MRFFSLYAIDVLKGKFEKLINHRNFYKINMPFTFENIELKREINNFLHKNTF